MPTEVFPGTREQLLRKSAAELATMLKERGGDPGQCLEKSEVVDRILPRGVDDRPADDSSSTTCPVCFEDYAPGDVLRVLRCGHRFHLECVDRWVLGAATNNTRPSCPMCNTELLR